MAIKTVPSDGKPPPRYSVVGESSAVLRKLAESCRYELPQAALRNVAKVEFVPSPKGDKVYFPCPLKEIEATAAIKALEACLAGAIADLRDGRETRTLAVDMDRVACFLMSTYMTTVDGMCKTDAEVKSRLIDTDLNQAQSILYRRLSANLYETRDPGEYYHIHGSLDASATLEMVGLPAFFPGLTDYRQCIDTIESAVKQFTVAQLESMNARAGQAGVRAMTWDQFRSSPHGTALANLPPFTVKRLECSTPPVPFPPTKSDNPQCLQGIRVLELCRIIAGPTIGRTLAAHGASVLKITSPNLPDVPFFQVDVNTGKHTAALHLRDNAADRARFEALLASADVLIDGYRPGALDRLGYGPAALASLARHRGKGFVYVAEDCFGGAGLAGAEWAGRPGWQQIADCATGVAFEQGRFMGLDGEPVVPPFPMSDYGTGALGAAAAMSALHRRATLGGSWAARTSLCQYDSFVLGLGPLPPHVQDRLRKAHDPAFFDLRHADSVDEVGRRALASVRRLHPHLFDDRLLATAWSPGFGANVAWPRDPVDVEGLRVGHVRATRPNAFDQPTWDGWEVDETLLEDGA